MVVELPLRKGCNLALMLPSSSGADMIMVPATDADIGEVVVSCSIPAYRGEGARDDQRGGVLPAPGQSGHACRGSCGGNTLPLMRDHEGAQLAGCVLLEPAGDTATWHLGMLTVDPRRQAKDWAVRCCPKRRTMSASRVRARKNDRHRALGQILYRMVRRRRPSSHLQASLSLWRRAGRRARPRDDLHFVVLEKLL